MLKFLADENPNFNTTRGLSSRTPRIDVLSVHGVGLAGADDCSVLEWAALNERVLIAHDRNTLVRLAYDRASAGIDMPGVIEVAERFPVGIPIDLLSNVAATLRS